MNKTIYLYCTLDDACLRNGAILNRLHVSGFKPSLKKKNLYYRVLTKKALTVAAIGVSYYYYEVINGNSKCIRKRDSIFDALCKACVDAAELRRHQEEFNELNGYTKEYFLHIARKQPAHVSTRIYG